ncbi:MAG: hypothetical protein WCY58_00835 [Mariniphaga sp.]
MYNSFSKYYLLICSVLVLAGCQGNLNSNEILVAEVGEKKLYLKEISALIPSGTDREDSVVMADDYIKKWVRQELVLLKAEENLSSSLKNVDKELEEYRNSLIIFRYKNEMMAQRLDSTVNDNEIMEIYAQNPENFKLNQNIVKAIFMKIPADFANPEEIKEMSTDTSDQGINEIREYCLKYAKGFDLFSDHWIELDQVMKNFPESIENPEAFLKENQIVEYTDSDYYYLMTILDYKLKNEQAPVEYVKDNIKSLILNRRKIEFLRELENNIYREGENKRTFRIYKIEASDSSRQQ